MPPPITKTDSPESACYCKRTQRKVADYGKPALEERSRHRVFLKSGGFTCIRAACMKAASNVSPSSAVR